jgi:hypothetical protein
MNKTLSERRDLLQKNFKPVKDKCVRGLWDGEGGSDAANRRSACGRSARVREERVREVRVQEERVREERVREERERE